MIIFVGIAGSGKSIQGRMLSQSLGCDYFSVGEFLRNHLDENINQKMLTGELINDQEVISVVNESLLQNTDTGKQYIVDGFPRTVAQVDWLVEEVEKGRFKIDEVIHLKARPEVIVPRLLERKRPDDHMEAIQHRIDEYNNAIVPILEKLKNTGIKICEIDGEQDIGKVNKDILLSLQSK